MTLNNFSLFLHRKLGCYTDADQAKINAWIYANKVCRHTLINTLSNDLFDVYHVYKEASKIWESLIIKYTAEDAGKQKFVVGNFYKWEMTEKGYKATD